jgi:hypothetical protein
LMLAIGRSVDHFDQIAHWSVDHFDQIAHWSVDHFDQIAHWSENHRNWNRKRTRWASKQTVDLVPPPYAISRKFGCFSMTSFFLPSFCFVGFLRELYRSDRLWWLVMCQLWSGELLRDEMK